MATPPPVTGNGSADDHCPHLALAGSRPGWTHGPPAPRTATPECRDPSRHVVGGAGRRPMHPPGPCGRDRVCALLPGFPSPPARDGVQPALLLPAAPDWVGLLCGSAWILAALFGLIRVVRGYCVMRTLRRTSTPFDAVRERQLPLWSVHARARAPPCRAADFGRSCGRLRSRIPPPSHRRRTDPGRAAGRCRARSGGHARVRAPRAVRRLAAAVPGHRTSRWRAASRGVLALPPHRPRSGSRLR